LCSLDPQDIGSDTVPLALGAILSGLLEKPEGCNIIPIDRIDSGDHSVNPRLVIDLPLQQTLRGYAVAVR
jgi:hypothetical protein